MMIVVIKIIKNEFNDTFRYLANWAKSGVLLLNATLTVRAHEPMSHSGKGWETFTGT